MSRKAFAARPGNCPASLPQRAYPRGDRAPARLEVQRRPCRAFKSPRCIAGMHGTSLEPGLMDDPHLSHLLDAWFNGVLTPDQKADLEQMLLSSSAARRQ